jgi:hypothetical protein
MKPSEAKPRARGPARLALCGAALLYAAPAPAAAKPIVAVADFDYADTSGEVTDQSAAHAARIKMLHDGIMAAVARDSAVAAVALQCASPPCSADRLGQQGVMQAAGFQHADFVVFGGVHKISTLIQFGAIDIMDAHSGKATLSREVQFRGDNDDAWQHAAAYIGQLVRAGLPQ